MVAPPGDQIPSEKGPSFQYKLIEQPNANTGDRENLCTVSAYPAQLVSSLRVRFKFFLRVRNSEASSSSPTCRPNFCLACGF